MKSVLTCLAVSFIAFGCGDSKETRSLKAETLLLKAELEECKFGADKLAAMADKAYADQSYAKAREYIEALQSKHPDSPRNGEFAKLLIEIRRNEQIAVEKQLAEEKERVRLANINNLGMWEIGHFVDEFGERTTEKYIANSEPITGTFSNTATQDSPLLVNILITDTRHVAILLYEYARNNPVKASSREYYRVFVKDSSGNRLSMTAENNSDRLRFDGDIGEEIHSALLKGGTIEFRISEFSRPTSQYAFTITDANWYENAYQHLIAR